MGRTTDTGVSGGIKKEHQKMSKDISTPYTKERNEKCGRKGYSGFKREKETIISPKDYGMFLRKVRGAK